MFRLNQNVRHACLSLNDIGGTALSRRWTLLLPVIFITYSLAYLDRANFSFAAAGGMAKDLGITASENALLSALFFLGYFMFQIPGAAYAQKYSVKKLILWGLIGWVCSPPSLACCTISTRSMACASRWASWKARCCRRC
jgi:sugar phosphate permease